MIKILMKEEGVATAVGAILSILVVVLLLSIFVTSYVPSEMTVYEENYTSNLLNSVMQLNSYISVLYVSGQVGETVTVPFELESGSVPFFSSPTVGTISISGAKINSPFFIKVSNATENLTSGGYIYVSSNNRYYVDQSYYYALSSIIESQQIKGTTKANFVESNLVKIEDTGNTITLIINLVKIEAGNMSVTAPGPVAVSLQTISLSRYVLAGNVTIEILSQLGYSMYSMIQEELSPYNIHLSYSNITNGIVIGISSQESLKFSVTQLDLSASIVS
ncbi:MAG: hypothetical protein QW302_05565 [Thermoplasmatales archaeon]